MIRSLLLAAMLALLLALPRHGVRPERRIHPVLNAAPCGVRNGHVTVCTLGEVDQQLFD